MKKIVYFLCIGFLLNSCGRQNEENVSYETIKTDITITEYSVGKYTYVKGFVTYKGFKLFVENGDGGYYYITYNLKINDVVHREVTVRIEENESSGINISALPVDFSDYESYYSN